MCFAEQCDEEALEMTCPGFYYAEPLPRAILPIQGASIEVDLTRFNVRTEGDGLTLRLIVEPLKEAAAAREFNEGLEESGLDGRLVRAVSPSLAGA